MNLPNKNLDDVIAEVKKNPNKVFNYYQTLCVVKDIHIY